MAVNPGKIDLNVDSVLFDREMEVLGFNSPLNNASVGVSHSETLIGDSIGGDGGVDQKDCIVGNDGETNGLVELLSEPVMVGFQMNLGNDDMMIDGSGKEGFCEETMNGLEVGVFDVVDGGFGGKELVKNEDEKSLIQCSDEALDVIGGDEHVKGLTFEFNDGVQNEMECENIGNVASSNEAQGVYGGLTECSQEVKNVAFANLREVVGDDGVMTAADIFVTNDGNGDSLVAEVAAYQIQDGIPFMEDMNVDAKESSDVKEPAFQADAQVNVVQNQTADINIDGAGLSENSQLDCSGFNLVVDLNSFRNTQEDGMCKESVFSEDDFRVSDMVWAKVRGHPWWPGQICDPSAASEKAKRHLKENCYLIAYFGDQTFAWNDVSTIKPFQMHFSQMEKQSNTESFCHAVYCALEELSRRIEFGLSCPCLPEEMFSRLKTQVIANAGILTQLRIRTGGDRFINATSFEPSNLVNFVKSLAQSLHDDVDKLDVAITRAQLLAFYRTKGYSQLPEFTMPYMLFVNDIETPNVREKEQCDDQINEQVLEAHIGFSETSKHISRVGKKPGKKRKLLSVLMYDKNSCIPNGESTLERKAGDKPTSRRGRKRKAAFDTADDYSHNPQIKKVTQLQCVSIDEMLSQVCLAAKDPMGESDFSDMIYFFAEFRKFNGPDHSASLELGMSSEQMHGGEAGVSVTSIEAVPSMTPAMELCNDSYWTDRIIQSISEDQPLFKNPNERDELLTETPTEVGSPSYKSQPGGKISINLSFEQQDADGNLGSERSSLVEDLDESSPTSLTLKFTNLDSVPSTTDLNEIFGRFGPLIECKTELLKKSNCARVVFKKRAHAESAFSSAGKYSIFGPSLVSYRLKILPRTPKQATGKRVRKSKKEKSSVDGAAV